MSYGYSLSSLNSVLIPPVKRKIFVSYHHDNDQWYYNEFRNYIRNEGMTYSVAVMC